MNARVGQKSEVVTLESDNDQNRDICQNIDLMTNAEDSLSALGLTEKRSSLDDKTNNFGNKLLDLCRMNTLYIFNGRVGRDKDIGMSTSKSNSVVDYAVGVATLLAKVSEFEVLTFDRLLSDIHSPIHIVWQITDPRTVVREESTQTYPTVCKPDHNFKLLWMG